MAYEAEYDDLDVSGTSFRTGWNRATPLGQHAHEVEMS